MKPGRPALSEASPTVLLKVLLPEAEKARLERLAAEEGFQSLAAYIRHRLGVAAAPE